MRCKCGERVIENTQEPDLGLFDLFRRKSDAQGVDLYESALSQARQPIFHTQLGVPDTLDGRFDLIVLHLCLVRQALLSAGEEEGDGPLLQAMDERFITDMDYALREVGVGDLSVGKQVKSMAGAYQGRWRRYKEAFADENAGDLAEALLTNVYRGTDVPAENGLVLATYCQTQIAALAGAPAAIRSGKALPWSPLATETPRDAA